MNLACNWTGRSHRCCSDKRRPRGGRRCLRCKARVARDCPGFGASQRVQAPQPTAGFRLPATCTAWPRKNSELMAVASTCLECRLQLCLKPPRSAGPAPAHSAYPPPPGIYLCHWTVVVTLKLRFTFSRTFISGSFMTLGECAKFLIRFSRQPEAAAAPLSLHGLSALQHNKPLYSFEDNADYVYDVMWSPVHPALFACVDGMGRLDLWNLNSDTEVSSRRPGPRAGRGHPGHSAVWFFLQKIMTFCGQTLQLPLGSYHRTPILDYSEENEQMYWPKLHVTSSLNCSRS